MFDLNTIRAYLAHVVAFYEESAPTVSQWADDLYVRLGDNPREVKLGEIMAALSLREDTVWLHPNYAANFIFKTMHEYGQDVTGHFGF